MNYNYKILRDTDPENLVNRVIDLGLKGCKCVGGVFILFDPNKRQTIYVQAVEFSS